jgi:hypothetical protein
MYPTVAECALTECENPLWLDQKFNNIIFILTVTNSLPLSDPKRFSISKRKFIKFHIQIWEEEENEFCNHTLSP